MVKYQFRKHGNTLNAYYKNEKIASTKIGTTRKIISRGKKTKYKAIKRNEQILKERFNKHGTFTNNGTHVERNFRLKHDVEVSITPQEGKNPKISPPNKNNMFMVIAMFRRRGMVYRDSNHHIQKTVIYASSQIKKRPHQKANYLNFEAMKTDAKNNLYHRIAKAVLKTDSGNTYAVEEYIGDDEVQYGITYYYPKRKGK